MEPTRKLTPKQQRFVEEYLVDLNATQAAQSEINTGLVASLKAIDSALSLREGKTQESIKAQLKLAQDQLKQQTDANFLLEAQIQQAAAAYGSLMEQLNVLNGNVTRLVGNADLAVAEPS